MKGHQLKRTVGPDDRHNPVARGRQALGGLRLGAWERRAVDGRQQGTGHIAPQKGGQVLHVGGVDGQAGQDRHAALPRKPPVSLGVTRPAKPPVSVQIQTGGHARVGAQGKSVGIIRHLCQTVQGFARQIVVDALQRDNVRVSRCNDRQNGGDLRILAAREIPQEQPWSVALEFGVVGGDAQGLRKSARARARNQAQAKCNQATCKSLSAVA